MRLLFHLLPPLPLALDAAGSVAWAVVEVLNAGCVVQAAGGTGGWLLFLAQFHRLCELLGSVHCWVKHF